MSGARQALQLGYKGELGIYECVCLCVKVGKVLNNFT